MGPLGRKFKRLSDEQIDEIIEIIRITDSVVHKNILIESYVPLVIYCSSKIGSGFQYKLDDIISSGLLALTVAVNKISTLEHVYDVPAYIGKYIVGEIRHFIALDTIIKVPPYATRYKYLRTVYTEPYLWENVPVEGDQATFEIEEYLETIPRNEIQKTILNCMMEGGYTGLDIADMCAVSEARISQVKDTIMERIERTL